MGSICEFETERRMIKLTIRSAEADFIFHQFYHDQPALAARNKSKHYVDLVNVTNQQGHLGK